MNHDKLKDTRGNKREKKSLLYGIHPIKEALDNRTSLEKIMVLRDTSNRELKEIMALASQLGVPVSRVPSVKLNKICGKNHQGVIAFNSPVEYQSIENLVPFLYDEGKMPFILILDRVTDVGNLGAIARSAECFGVDAIVIPNADAAQVTPDAVKTSSGALQKIAVCREKKLDQVVRFLKDSGVAVYAASEKSSHGFEMINSKSPMALIMGAEGEGVHPSLLKLCDGLIRIPMKGTIQSLNVSVAAGIMLYEMSKEK